MTETGPTVATVEQVAEPSGTSAGGEVTTLRAWIRMYAQGLGDCFLLTLPRAEGAGAADGNTRPVYVVIDCGVVAGTPAAADRMRRVVRDIRLETQDGTLTRPGDVPKGHIDLLVITHDHWDAVSGFSEAKDEWEQILVDALWMPWTERSEGDALADELRQVTGKQRGVLARTVDVVKQTDLDGDLGLVIALNDFLAAAPADEDEAATVREYAPNAITMAKARVAKRNRVYCEPGEVRLVPGTRAQAYVLGPPRDWDSLRSISRRRPAGDKKADTKPGDAAESPRDDEPAIERDPAASIRRVLEEPSPLNAIIKPLLDLAMDRDVGQQDTLTPEDQDVIDRSYPFDRLVRVPLPTAEAAAAGYPEIYAALDAYFDESSYWRRIDTDWLMGVAPFALEADTLINNTSLVLAIELPPAETGADAKVLLFVGDAQVGNWLSWDDIPAWRPLGSAKPSQAAPDIADLLKRTAFYKVGHHGAHNATPKAKGVERLRSDGTLTAFVPVSMDAAKRKGWPNMPNPDVLDALSALSGSRVVLATGSIWGSDDASAAARPDWLEVSPEHFPATDDTGALTDSEGDPLWVEVAIAY